jgi:flagellar biosynthesis GTPase FlhF
MKGGGYVIKNDEHFFEMLPEFKSIIEKINALKDGKHKLHITFDTDTDKIVKTYRANARVFHPDKNPEHKQLFSEFISYISYDSKEANQFIDFFIKKLAEITPKIATDNPVELDEVLKYINIIKSNANIYNNQGKRQRQERERQEQERQERERQEQERQERERQERERQERERQEHERQERERQERERRERERRERERQEREKISANKKVLEELIKSEKYKDINYKSLFKLLSENNNQSITETNIQEYINNIALLYPLVYHESFYDVMNKNYRDKYKYLLLRITTDSIILFYSEDTKDTAIILYKFSKNDSDSLLTDMKKSGINFNNLNNITLDDM